MFNKSKLATFLVCIFVLLPLAASAEKFHWLVHDLGKVSVKDTAKISSVMKGLPKGAIIEIEAKFTVAICDFEKSIVTYRNHLKNTVAVCAYQGVVRNYQ